MRGELASCKGFNPPSQVCKARHPGVFDLMYMSHCLVCVLCMYLCCVCHMYYFSCLCAVCLGCLSLLLCTGISMCTFTCIYMHYIYRHRSRIRGLFRAITQPTSISSVLSEGAFQEKLFNSMQMYTCTYYA